MIVDEGVFREDHIPNRLLHRETKADTLLRAWESGITSKDQLQETLHTRINELLLGERLGQYSVEVDKGSLVVVDENLSRPVTVAAAEKTMLTHCSALAAAEMLPKAPPLFGNSIFSRLTPVKQKAMADLLKEQFEPQIILFGVSIDFEKVDLTPCYELENTNHTASQIVHLPT